METKRVEETVPWWRGVKVGQMLLMVKYKEAEN